MLKVLAYGEPMEKAILRLLYASDLNWSLLSMQTEYEDIVMITISSEFFIADRSDRVRPNSSLNILVNKEIRQKTAVIGIRGPPIIEQKRI